ncbi:hypothetical protein FALBO_590 [Fusarium albosuccineum]|uniref:C2H2-type domain-containing protein n=1 Tax=Fusarium albosuccineum TaxID=1237068 RepID=A0A8H4LN78_9HYPO|nr:hypothetical protein FALBO_590 [Fusarium albosuccineum]
MEASATTWELDSDEIASIASEDLHEHRPNRWTGPKSTWRTLTEEDRLLFQSMKQLQDQDLALHLYNAFALKRRGRDEGTAQDLLVKTEDGQDAVWAPPKLWTAWPVKHKQVPRETLINSQHDEDDRFTFRKQEEILPSTELEEEISATILRTAKRRFRRRKSKMAQPSIEEPSASYGESGNDTSDVLSRESSVKPGIEDESDKVAVDTEERRPARWRRPKDYEPVESTNDELSYQLLRPSVRHILSQLDATLSILNNSRVAGMSYLSDSSTEDESDSQSGQKRSRGRPRKLSHESASPSPGPAAKSSRRGRPRKVHVPRDGETHEEMLLRVARESHRKLPTTPKDRDDAFEEWMRKGEEAAERERALSLKRELSQGVETEDDGSTGGTNADRRLARWGLRDWSDVLGAAAIAGFSGDVIARTARRCANLFQEGMAVRTLNEVPVSHGSGVKTVEYRPETVQLSYSDSDADDESDDAADLTQRRVASRQASIAHSSRSPDSLRSSRRSTRSPAPSSAAARSPRSRSGSAGGLLFCPIPSCDRAARGFARKANLRRHLELVHQGQTEELDSDDEVMGGVHVDGFLKPIVPGRGWRGEDTIQRKRKRFYGERAMTSREGSLGAGDASS